MFSPLFRPKSESLFTQSHFAKELREWFDLFHEEIAILLKKIERFTWKTERIPNPAWNKICSLNCLNVKNLENSIQFCFTFQIHFQVLGIFE